MWERATARMGVCIFGDVREGYVIQLGREGIQDPVLGGAVMRIGVNGDWKRASFYFSEDTHAVFMGQRADAKCSLCWLAGWVGVGVAIGIGIR